MNWSNLQPWIRTLVALRTALLTLGGFTSLAVAAFLWSVIAGWAVVGICLIVLEALLQPSKDDPRRR